MRLNVDLHTHLKVSKRTPLQPTDPSRYARTLERRGIHALAITEHFHAPGFWDMYRALYDEWPYRKGRFDVHASLFYTGAELTLAEGVDVVLLAPLRDLRALDRAFPTPLSEDFHPTGEALLEALDRLGSPAVRIAAHPIRDDKHLSRLQPAVARSLFHALEVNARYSDPAAVRSVRAMASARGLPVTAGSDAHVWVPLAAAFTAVDARSDGFDDLRDAILAGAVEPVVAPTADALVRAGADMKAALKAILPRLPKPAPASGVTAVAG